MYNYNSVSIITFCFFVYLLWAINRYTLPLLTNSISISYYYNMIRQVTAVICITLWGVL